MCYIVNKEKLNLLENEINFLLKEIECFKDGLDYTEFIMRIRYCKLTLRILNIMFSVICNQIEEDRKYKNENETGFTRKSKA